MTDICIRPGCSQPAVAHGELDHEPFVAGPTVPAYADAEPVNVETLPPFDLCPVCGSSSIVRLVSRWRELHIPVVGCGNPWHYIEPTASGMDRPAGATS